MAIVIASISAPNATIATEVGAVIGRRFSLRDAQGAPRTGTKADLENALRNIVKDWVIQDRAERAAVTAKATEIPTDLT